jgi:hypothetical protein
MPKSIKEAYEPFVTAGTASDHIDVKISHRIIQLFSEGLYSSANKAVEELISNSFDAGALNVHVILSPDLREETATIVVIDDGEGMDADGLKQHWVIGRSPRREGKVIKGRKPIGKFGIGKLATYVLACRLTHICKYKHNYFAATMDYTSLESSGTVSEGVFDEKSISIPLRNLAEKEAETILRPWTNGTKDGYKKLKLFGKGASKSWTVAIMSNLKPMGQQVKRRKLTWILRTAMPLRDDFRLYLNGDLIEPSKIDLPLIDTWIIGKDIKQLTKPCPEGLEPTEDINVSQDSICRYGLSHRELGRITGYAELYEDELVGKSGEIERSNGFFVYVRGRMINTEDPGFGIERNLLRHGTFSRFRMVANIDSLDDALRSSRESLQQGELYLLAQNFLHAVFNLARNRLVEHERSKSPGAIISARISSAPGSLTRKPLLSLTQLAIEKKATPQYLSYPVNLSKAKQKLFLQRVQEMAESEEGLLRSTEIAIRDSKEGLAIYDIENGKLFINASHPFVAAFQEFFLDSRISLPLEMFAVSEVLMEANLYYMGVEETQIHDAMARRDELLRQFVRSSARRTAGMIALALMEARDDEYKLEEEMRAAFEAMGFANVIRIGGKGKPDGTAEAHLAATEDGTVQRYKVGLEAKSGKPVSAHRLNVSGIARHMEDYNCDHHIVIGNGFSTSTGEDSASVREIKSYKERTGKTITMMHIDDLARLVRLVPAKRVGLNRVREIFKNCLTQEESKEWINKLTEEKPTDWPYKEILETIWDRANKRPDTAIEYSAVMTALEYLKPPVNISKKDLIECCKAMQVMASGVVFARENTVEIDRRPDLILEDIRTAVGKYPEEERKTIHI